MHTTAQTPDVESVLARHAILSGLSAAARATIAAALEPISWSAGSVALREGMPGDGWYVIAGGMLALERQAGAAGEVQAVALLGAGESLGEALLSAPGTWALSARAITDVHAFRLTVERARSLSPLGRAIDAVLPATADLMAIAEFLRRASPFSGLPDEALWLLLRRMRPRHMASGDVLVRQGQPVAQLSLLVSGTADVWRGRRQVQRVGPGDVIGEMSLLSDTHASATVVAVEPLDVLVLPRADFEEALQRHPSLRAFFEEIAGVRAAWLTGRTNTPRASTSAAVAIPAWWRSPRAAAALCLGTAIFVLLTLLVTQGRTAMEKYAVLVVGSVVGPASFVIYLAERHILAESVRRVLACGFLAASLGVPVALLAQQQLGVMSGDLRAALLIALIEEPAKILGVVWAVRNRYVRFETDGILYGAAAGMGFAVLENVLYGWARLGTPELMLETLWLRTLLSPFTHGAWTALACTGLWRARQGDRWRRLRSILLFFGGAVGLHALWDWRPFPPPANFAWLLLVGIATLLLLRDLHVSALRAETRSVLALDPAFAGAIGPRSRRCHVCGQWAPASARYCPRCTVALKHPPVQR